MYKKFSLKFIKYHNNIKAPFLEDTQKQNKSAGIKFPRDFKETS